MRNLYIAALTSFTLTAAVLCATAARAGADAPNGDARLCANTIDADVVAIDQPIFFNRLGANMPGGMIYALRRDIVSDAKDGEISAGHARLNPNHRPRPLVLRARVGDCLHIRFQNLLAPNALEGPEVTLKDPKKQTKMPCDPTVTLVGQEKTLRNGQTCTRAAGVHVAGMEEGNVDATLGDGSFVGANPSSLVAPGEKIDYTLRAPAEGVFLMYSTAANASTNFSGGGVGGQLSAGLFGSVVVEPASAEWYRSQVTKVDLDAATTRLSADLHPILNYGALRKEADGSCTPILRMVDRRYKQENGKCVAVGDELVTYHGDLTALITGPQAGRFPESDKDPSLVSNPVEPNRREPYREFVQHYHDAFNVDQAFATVYNAEDTKYVMGKGADAFAINYGSDGIGSEILANRLGVGPEGGCVECRFEEFFLSSWAVGDPATLVGKPEGLQPVPQPRPVPYEPKTVLTNDDSVKYPDDPSNVYHSYIGDRVIFRIVHAGQLVTHLHHLHAHQWLHTPNSDTSTYLDSQLISPGSAFTQEIDYDGSGNRNRTPGDAIFHCHFYPHFAAGMWGMWRNHDVFEGGTDLNKDPAPKFTRALPDGQFRNGAPIPAIVPLPTLAMAPMPAKTKLCPVDQKWNGQQVLDGRGACPIVDYRTISGEVAYIAKDDFTAGRDPGYPFYVPGVAGQRAPHPPLGYAPDDTKQPTGQTAYLDGGLARHVTLAGEVSNDHYNLWDFSKDLDSVTAVQLNETGTPIEKLAMKSHSICEHASFTPEGTKAAYLLNGGPAVPGAPYANPSWGSKGATPCTDLADPKPVGDLKKSSRIYKAADIQMDVVNNKAGWHYPQQRFEALWQDVKPTVTGKRAPEPLFFRANSGETIEFWQTNLVPAYYELDDFEVRTPTDVIGQHIHLVKFDVTSSDGAANGYNYEAGSLSGEAVRDEIKAIRHANAKLCRDPNSISFNCPVAKPAPAIFGTAPAGQNWDGAQTTVERWWADPVVDHQGNDRTLRTVFTHDHFGPSTHQQTGLYSGLVVEPKGSDWRIPAETDPDTQTVHTNVPMGTRPDGGPTSWAADVQTADIQQSYREFALEFQDMQLAYTAASVHHATPYPCGPDEARPALKAEPAATDPYDCRTNKAPTAGTPVWGWANQTAALNRPVAVPAEDDPRPTPAPQLTPQLVSSPAPVPGVASLNYRSEPLPLRVAPAPLALASLASTVPVPTHNPADAAEDLALGYASIERKTPILNTQPPNTQKLWPEDAASNVTYPGGFIGAAGMDPYTPLLRAYPNDRVQIRVLVGAHAENHTFAMHGVKWLTEPSYENSGHVAAQPMGISEHFEMLFTVPPARSGDNDQDYLYQAGATFTDQEQGLWGIMRAYNRPQETLPTLPNNPAVVTAGEPPICPIGAPERDFKITAVTAKSVLAKQTLTYNSRSTGPITQPDALMYVLSSNLEKISGSYRLKNDAPIEPLILRVAAGECVHVALTNRLDPTEKNVHGDPIFVSSNPDTFPSSGMAPVSIYPSARVGLHAQMLEGNVLSSDGTRIGNNPDRTAAPGDTIDYTWYAGNRENDRFIPAELGVVNLQSADPIEQPAFGAVGALVVEPKGSNWQTDLGTAAAATIFQEGAAPAFREFVGVWQSEINKTSYPPGGKHQQVGEGLNYRAEPIPYRVAPLATDLADAYSNTVLGPGAPNPPILTLDPQTPVFSASSGMPVRFRFVNPGGAITLPEVFGHHWQEEPWREKSTIMGDNPLSQTMGAAILGPSHELNLVVDKAGVEGDYLYRNFIVTPGNYAMWGVFRVGPPASDVVVLTDYQLGDSGKVVLNGYVTKDLQTRAYAHNVALTDPPCAGFECQASVNQETGAFSFAAMAPSLASAKVTVRSDNGGEARAALPPPPALLAKAAIPAPVEITRADRLAFDRTQNRALQFVPSRLDDARSNDQ
ncbi:MAG: hypothetical protein WCC64_08030 [Aliidongia sp.]